MVALFLALSVAVSAAVGWVALSGGLMRLDERGRADLALAADRLLGQLQRYRETTVLMARHPAVLGLTLAPATEPGPVNALLQGAADLTRSDELILTDTRGHVLAATGSAGRSDHAGRPYFERAMQGALGFQHEIDAATGRRYFVYAAPVFSDAGPVIGALVARIATEAVEVIWRGEPMIVFFTDDKGLAFVSNRDELVLVRLALVSDAAEPSAPDLLRRDERRIAGHEIWDLDGGPYLPARALHLTRSLPVIGMTGEALVDIAPAERQALLLALMSATLCLGLGAIAFALIERRRALAVRLAAEADANARLEFRVAERTGELMAANQLLQRTQAELVQAGKLSALGQMSAGISHELNQPLMAIQSYAENAAQFLDRSEPARTAENLGRISELARRMGRIIRNLRAFSRRESGPLSDVDLGGVVAAALELTETRLAKAGVAVSWTPPPQPVLVRGGEVRLQQVVVNLLANAADAMAPRGEVSIAVVPAGGRVRLTVSDTGPGLAEPDRIFDPFYSTKEVGASEGMGLGLSISYGIVQSFGGTIAGRNRPEGGAEITVELAASPRAVRAA
ncbi:sensor histidine kinase [Albidovulum sp.]|uniref:sensor histidine kinase n=1 Tax=Albidovulum sp. TaxID=1872424 RepID=UPI001E05FD49|nr:sensor histidine kinase [Paracoccaceae bacterium]